LTTLKDDGVREVVEDQKPKLVYVKHWRGAFAFWGLARCGQWSTLDWLRSQAKHAGNFSTAENFANSIAAGLDEELGQLPLTKAVDKGIGIHFTVY
jgi:hypothetical protein